MKIPINKESMSNLRPGDTITVAIGGTMKVTERKQGFSPRPHDLKFEGFSGIYSYSDQGILCGGDIHPLDIVAIEKAAPKIPPDFIPWPKQEGEIQAIVIRNLKGKYIWPRLYWAWQVFMGKADVLTWLWDQQPKAY